MSREKAPRVVAELGRPETAEETAARKAENSRLYRSRKTINNLVYSLLVTVAAVVVIVFAVPRSDTSLLAEVDWHQSASDAQEAVDVTLMDPQLPDGWTSNKAELTQVEAPGVTEWAIGLISPKPDEDYVAVLQGVGADPTWQSNELKGSTADSVVTIDGVEWTVYDNRDDTAIADPGNVEYALATEAGSSTILVYGTADDETVQAVATAIADQVKANADEEGDE